MENNFERTGATFRTTTYEKLVTLAKEHDCYHNGKPSVSKLLKSMAQMVLMMNVTEELKDYKEENDLTTLEAIRHSARRGMKRNEVKKRV